MDQTDVQQHDPLADFLKQLEGLSQPEEKLRMAIDFMRVSISQNDAPFFKGFWEARKLCIPLFKQTSSPILRGQFWDEYMELTREGRRLKNLLDEEAAFAVEQIQIAIEALEKEVEALEADESRILEKAPALSFPQIPSALSKQSAFFEKKQLKLNLFNFYATQINSLRKELIKTEMRIRIKNQFFKRLSALGDRVFPPRKELITEVSSVFTLEVGGFVEAHFSPERFSPEEARRSVFHFREEIKGLQAMAKALTLNTHAFTSTREQLSHCWDQLRGLEKELKKEVAEQKQKSSENVHEVRAKIEEISKAFQEGTLSLAEGAKQLDEVLRWMRGIELTRNDVRMLKDAVQAARQPMEEHLRKEEEERLHKEKEIVQKRREEIELFKSKLSTFMETSGTSEAFEELRKEFAELSMSKGERQLLERQIKTLRDALMSKQEAAFLKLSDDDRAAFDQLQALYDQRKQRRVEVKAQIEEYRKILGGSNLDFERAIEYNELMAQEKENLERADAALQEIENKMRAFRKQS